jgi:hypothetical protein
MSVPYTAPELAVTRWQLFDFNEESVEYSIQLVAVVSLVVDHDEVRSALVSDARERVIEIRRLRSPRRAMCDEEGEFKLG